MNVNAVWPLFPSLKDTSLIDNDGTLGTVVVVVVLVLVDVDVLVEVDPVVVDVDVLVEVEPVDVEPVVVVVVVVVVVLVVGGGDTPGTRTNLVNLRRIVSGGSFRSTS